MQDVLIRDMSNELIADELDPKLKIDASFGEPGIPLYSAVLLRLEINDRFLGVAPADEALVFAS